MALSYNKDLNAINVFEFDIDYEKAKGLVGKYVDELNQSEVYHPTLNRIHLKDLSLPFLAAIPRWKGDMSWVSAASKETFELFENCFQALEIPSKITKEADLSFPVMMYSGFFVIRSMSEGMNFHEDFPLTGKTVFTLMTPIQLDDSEEFGHLLYKDWTGSICKYKYKKGKAVSFSGGFMHTTEPFKSDKRFIFLSFTYGTMDRDIWLQMEKVAMHQGVSYRDPAGRIVVVDPQFEQYF